MGPKVVRSTVLSEAEEAGMVAFRKKTPLPLDDVLYTLKETIPHLTRSSLHRCFVCQGVQRREPPMTQPAKKKPFKSYPVGYFHVDITEVRTAEGRFYLFVGIDRTSKLTYAERHPSANRAIPSDFLTHLIAAVPYKIHTVLTDNGIPFTHPQKDTWAFEHLFDRLCRQQAISHRLTQLKPPWTNGQVERMNRTLKEATVQPFYYASQAQLKSHLHSFLMAYHFSKRLKSLCALTPYEFICQSFNKTPLYFHTNPFPFTVGPNKKYVKKSRVYE